jgi:conjugative transfer pilus assembly protein TraH
MISFVPPSFEAGCGGVNFFTGSFSFISAPQFQQVLRDVASNASGLASSYAFSLALKAMCSSCLDEMKNLQEKISKFNKFFSNSCQMAQGLVDNTIDAFKSKDRNSDVFANITSGIGDLFKSSTGADATTPTANAISHGTVDICKYEVNLLWCAMKRNSINTWYPGGDNRLLETLMSYTGSYVVGAEVLAPDGKGNSPELIPIKPTGITVDNLVEGGEVIINICADGHGIKQCKVVTPTKVTIKGIQGQIRKLLLGDSSDVGIIKKFSTNTGVLTGPQKNLLANAPAGIGAMIRNLSVLTPGAANLFVNEAAPYLALDMVYVLMDDLLSTANMLDAGMTSSFIVEVKKSVLDASKKIQEEKTELRSKYMNQGELYAFYNDLIRAAKHKKYGVNFTNVSTKATTR